MQTKQVLIIVGAIATLALVGVAAFYLGDQFGPSAQARNVQAEFLRARGFQTGAGGTPGAGMFPAGSDPAQGARQAGRAVANGTVKGVQGNTITVTQRDGTTTTVTVDDKVIIQKTVTGALADIQPGMNIIVFEVTSGGSTTRRIQLTPGQ